MMDVRNGYLELQGLDEVLKALDRADKEVRSAAMKGLEEGGMNIIEDAMVNLRHNGSVVTGFLRRSGRVQKVNDTSLDVGFFDTTNKNSGYALYVEYGRRSGKFPPLDEIVQWVKTKFSLKDKDARSVGFLVARKIAQEGSKPHPFFGPAVQKNHESILRAVRNALQKHKDTPEL